MKNKKGIVSPPLLRPLSTPGSPPPHRHNPTLFFILLFTPKTENKEYTTWSYKLHVPVQSTTTTDDFCSSARSIFDLSLLGRREREDPVQNEPANPWSVRSGLGKLGLDRGSCFGIQPVGWLSCSQTTLCVRAELRTAVTCAHTGRVRTNQLVLPKQVGLCDQA